MAPVKKVMETLQNLLQSVQQESQVDQANYKDQFNWCNEAFAEQKSSQQRYNDLNADLSSKLAAEQATGRQLKDAAAEQEKEMAEAKQAAEQAATLRQKEHEDFVGEQQSMMSMVNILGRASSVLSATPSLDSLKAVAESLMQVASKSGAISAAQKDQLASFSRSVAGAADAEGLKAEVGAASQTLQGLIAKFQDGLSGAQAKERQALSEYNGIIRLKQQSLAQLGAAKDTTDARLAECLQKAVQLQRSLRDVQALATAEASHSQGLQSVCSGKSSRWSVRSRTRVGIAERLQQVVAALHSDVLGLVADATKVTHPGTQMVKHPVSMLQTQPATPSSVSHPVAAQPKPILSQKDPSASRKAAAPALKTQAGSSARKPAAPPVRPAALPVPQPAGQPAKRSSQQPAAQAAAPPANEAPSPLGDVPEVDLGDSPVGVSFLQTGEDTNSMSLPQGGLDPAAPPMIPADAGGMQLPETMLPPQDINAMGSMDPPSVPSAVAIPSGAMDAPGAMVAPVAMASPDVMVPPPAMVSPASDPMQLGGMVPPEQQTMQAVPQGTALVQLPAPTLTTPPNPGVTMKQVVNQLQGQLVSGETDEEKHKEWCESETSKNQAALIGKTTKLQHISTKIESRRGSVTELDQDLQFLARENQTLQVRLARLGQVTQAEGGGESTASQDQQMAERILKQATTILERFGSSHRAPPPAAESFLQVASTPQRGPAPVSAVEGLKETALRYQQLGQVLAQSKAQAENDLKTVAHSSQDLRGVLAQAKDYQTSLRIELMSGLDSDQEDQGALSSEVDSVKAYVKHLQQACADIASDYDERTARGKDGIKDLEQAGTTITADVASAAGTSAKDTFAPGVAASSTSAGTPAGESIVSDLQSLQDINSKTA